MTDLSRHSLLNMKTDPVALLVDGENLSSDFAEIVLKLAKDFGVPTVRRVYGKAAHITGWAEQGYKLVPTRMGKNAADILLCIEAVNLALREQFHTFVIAASDRDYAYLAEHLRELGHEIIGMGEPSTEKGYRATCTAFVELRRQRDACELTQLPEKTTLVEPAIIICGSCKVAEKAILLNDVDKQLQLLLKGKTKLSLLALGLAMKGQTVRARTGCTTWRSYLSQRKDLYRIEADGANSVVSWIGP